MPLALLLTIFPFTLTTYSNATLQSCQHDYSFLVSNPSIREHTLVFNDGLETTFKCTALGTSSQCKQLR